MALGASGIFIELSTSFELSGDTENEFSMTVLSFVAVSEGL
jgi:hypothetical protein